MRITAMNFYGLALYAALVGTPGATWAESVDKASRLQSGRLSVFERSIGSASDGVRVTYIAVRPPAALRLLVPRKPEAGGSSLRRFASDEKPKAIVSGGLLETYAPAVSAGLVYKNGQELNALKSNDPVLTGIVCFKGEKSRGNVFISSVDNFNDIKRRYKDCLQSGVLLLSEEKNASNLEEIDRSSRSRGFASRVVERTFIATRSDGYVFVGITSPATLWQLRGFISGPISSGGLQSSAAITLSGRSTAGLIVSGKSEIVRGRTDILLPNTIGIY